MKKVTIPLMIVFVILILSITPNRVSSSQSLKTTTADTVILEPLMSHIGGESWRVLVDGNYAYIGLGPELAILDVSIPNQPIRVGSLTLSDTRVLNDIEKSGGYVFVVQDGGLHIIDVVDVAHPVLLSTYSISGYGSALSVALSGNYAYVGYEDSLCVVDISDPANPTEMDIYNNIKYVHDISVVGNYAYLAMFYSGVSDYNGLAVLNISNPAEPALVTLPLLKHGAFRLAISGNYAYMAAGGGLEIYDISNPTLPAKVGSSDPAGEWAALGVTVSGQYAYLAKRMEGLLIFDITDPAHPTQVGTYTYSAVWDVTVIGNNAYLATGGLEIIDISNPASLVKVGDYNGPGQSNDVIVANGYAYLVGVPWLSVIDISNPENPWEVGEKDDTGFPSGVTFDGQYLYVANGEIGLQIMDVSDPAHPTEIGRFDTPYSVQNVTVVDHLAYVADKWGGLRIIDVTTPITPTETGHLDLGEGKFAWDVDIVGKYAYVGYTGDHRGLQIIDVSDPGHPLIIGDYATTVPILEVVVHGQYAYLAAFGEASLHIIDISNPANPTFVGGGATPSTEAYSVDVSGEYAYVTDVDGISIFDISDPAAPARVGYFDTSGGVYGVDIAGNYVYIAGFNGLFVFRSLQEMITTDIAPVGGSLSSVDGNINFIFPSGAFTQTTNVTYKHFLVDENTDNYLGIDQTFKLSAVYSDTQQSAALVPGETFSITFTYTPTQLGPVIENTLALFYWNGSQWVQEPSSSLDMSNKIISATSDKIALWAVLGETRRIYLPAIYR